MFPSRMRPFGDVISIETARDIVRGSAVPLSRLERVPLDDARNRVIASDVIAGGDVPPFARAAMDGYAVRAGDTQEASRGRPAMLRVIETIYTGQVPTARVGSGECSEIATGAPLPEGADAVVMVEETEPAADGMVRVFSSVQPFQHVGPQGADIRAGQAVLTRGDVLTPSRIGAAAALGHSEVDVFAKPRVAILSTGNEIVPPGRPLSPGQIYDVNRYTLAAVVGDHGGVPVPYGTALDTLTELTSAVDACLAEDCVVVSGGSSVGERDLIVDVVSKRGEVRFHGIAVKPGKPTLFGIIGGKPIFGLSGYPTSCLVNAYVLIVPLLHALAHLPPYTPQRISLPLARRVKSAPGRHQFLTVRVADGLAVPAFKASGDITSMSQADGYFEIPAQVESVEEGGMVEVVLF
jgi:molybdenum cofactor synthesis domain-containing protein